MKRPFIFGLLGSIALLMVYAVVSLLFNKPDEALDQFLDVWYWVIILAAGFGVQIGLYKYVRIVLKKKKDSLLGGVSASGGVSTLSMLACCAHHIADVLPFLGLSAAAVFLAQFYIPFILLGILAQPIFFSCKDDDEAKGLIDISGITELDNFARNIGNVDITDWKFIDTWSLSEENLFKKIILAIH